MPELWFVVGLAMGIVVTGFVAIGSFERGVESVNRKPWQMELVARKRASVVTRAAVRGVAFVAPVPVAAPVPEVVIRTPEVTPYGSAQRARAG